MQISMDHNIGYLSLYLGPMFSGKTSRLLEIYKQCKLCDIPVLVINFIEDTRYTSESQLSSHDRKMIPCTSVTNLSEVQDYNNPPCTTFHEAKVILINEGQFFSDIVPWVQTAILPPYNKIIHICGLDGDFLAQQFGTWLNLIPVADHVEKLTAICAHCKKRPGIFSHRITTELCQKVIRTDSYVPLCRLCYHSAKTCT